MAFSSLLLRNGGCDKNMCSLNSNIQLLRHIPEFQHEIKSWETVTPLLNALNQIFSRVGTGKIISASILRECLAQETGRPVNNGNQWDTVELLGYLLDHCPSDLFDFETTVEYRFQVEGRGTSCPVCKKFPDPVTGSEKVLKLALLTSSSSNNLDMLLKRHFSIRN